MARPEPLIVVTSAEDWPLSIPDTRVVLARDYLTTPEAFEVPGAKTKVYNLCSSYRYQKAGYYVSLLAEARGHRPLPDVSTIQELKSTSMIVWTSEELYEQIQKSLSGYGPDELQLYVFFGRTPDARFSALARALFRQLPTPLLRADLTQSHRRGRWRLRNVQALGFGDVPEPLRPAIEAAARDYFPSRYHPRPNRRSAAWDMAILRDANEAEPPSDEEALRRFLAAAEAEGFDAELIDKDDFDRLGEYDALFIRETTAVNHRTYRFAQRAAAAGLVVIDDPVSILRCTNKVFLAEVLTRHGVPAPETMVVHRGNAAEVCPRLGLPCILKQPDSAFSQGVVKVDTPEELKVELDKLLDRSDLAIAQAFTPTEFDWRIGIIDGQALYACKYFMARRHWQIILREGGTHEEGDSEAVALDRVPPAVLKVALKAASLMGDSLYGVDLKEIDGRPYVIEVNDNPSIDAGYEDALLGETLYRRIMATFRERLERRGKPRR